MDSEAKIAQFIGHKDCVYALENGPKTGCFFSGSADGMVVLWDIKKPEKGLPIAKVRGSVYALFYNSVGNEILIASNRDGLHLIDLNTKTEIWSFPSPDHQWFRMQNVGKHVWILGSKGRVLIMDLKSRTVEEKQFGQHDLRSIDVDRNESKIGIGNSNKEIFIVSLGKNTVNIIPNAHLSTVFGIRFHPYAQKFISAGRDAKLKIWGENLKGDWALENEVAAHLFSIHDIKLHPTKPILISGSTDKNIKIWHPETLKLLRVLDKTRHAGHGHSVNQLLWLENTEVLLSCSDDRTISAWNIFE